MNCLLNVILLTLFTNHANGSDSLLTTTTTTKRAQTTRTISTRTQSIDEFEVQTNETNTAEQSTSDGGHSLDIGLILGIALGCITILLGILACFLLRKRFNKRSPIQHYDTSENGDQLITSIYNTQTRDRLIPKASYYSKPLDGRTNAHMIVVYSIGDNEIDFNGGQFTTEKLTELRETGHTVEIVQSLGDIIDISSIYITKQCDRLVSKSTFNPRSTFET